MEAQVTKVLTKRDGDGVVATGIEYVNDGKTFTAKTLREVILSAGTFRGLIMSWQLIIVSRVGAFQTPQLLELSGIGDSSILKKFGIEQVLDLPSVGQNLRKRNFLIIIFWKIAESSSYRGPSEYCRYTGGEARYSDIRNLG